jgi:hypothetical protein
LNSRNNSLKIHEINNNDRFFYHRIRSLDELLTHLSVPPVNFQLVLDVRRGMKILAKFAVAFSLSVKKCSGVHKPAKQYLQRVETRSDFSIIDDDAFGARMGELALVLGAFAGAAHKLAADLDFEPLGVPEIALDNALN